jgi:hypothetical protein
MAINIYEPSKFRTQGIEDLSTQLSLTVHNGRIVVDYVEPKKDLQFTGNNFSELEGRGIKWTDNRKTKSFKYAGNSLKSDLSINLEEEETYKIADTSVISLTELGNTVTKSNLKTVGILRSLKVSGNTELGEFVFFNSDLNRVGINDDAPGASLTIKENNCIVGLGSKKNNIAFIGTLNNSNLDIGTDGEARISLLANNVVRVRGKLIADSIETEATPYLLFKETESETNYGKGIVWHQMQGPNKQLILQANPDRIFSTETIDLDQDKYYSINNMPVLTYRELGNSVLFSNLIKVGVLQDLQVAGDAAIARRVMTSQVEVGRFVIDEDKLTVRDTLEIARGNTTEIKVADTITIGNVDNNNRAISIYGKLVVGSASPKDNADLTVNGSVSFSNKRFEVGAKAPTSGNYNKGDIVWNTEPQPNSYIGWVCVVPGAPGVWLPFGTISSR